MGIGRLLLRVVIGGIFVGHGLQKLTGAFGGPGLRGTEKMMEGTRMYPTRRNALAAALTETLGGAGIVLGAGMPAATAAVTAAMSTAVTKVHKKNGFWNANGGYEFNLALVASATALTIDGPGPLSVDAALGKHRWGVFWGLLGFGVGMVAASFAVELGEDAAPDAAGDGDSTAGDSTVGDSAPADSAASDSSASDSSAAD
jgi:putative oxidoreductase